MTLTLTKMHFDLCTAVYHATPIPRYLPPHQVRYEVTFAKVGPCPQVGRGTNPNSNPNPNPDP